MHEIATLFGLIFGHPILHHPVLVLPYHGYKGLTGVIRVGNGILGVTRWGAR